jgi:hypothetical protein
MNPNDIHRALREDREITPSPEFAGRVMRAVRQHTDESEALSFPWRRLLPGLAVTALLVVAGLVMGPPSIDSRAMAETLNRIALRQSAAWIPMTLVGSYALVWCSLRMSGYRR